MLVTPLDPVEAGPDEPEPAERADPDDAGHALERPDADDIGATGAMVAPQEGSDARQ